MEQQNENTYLLTIRFSQDGISMSVREESWLELSTKTIQANISTMSPDELIGLLQAETEINNCRIKLIYESDVYTFVPSPLFDYQDTALYLSFQHSLAKTEKAAFNAIPTWDIVNVFSLPNSLLQALTRLYPGITIEHHMSVLLSDKVKRSGGTELHLWAREHSLDAIVLNNNKLQLLNSFGYKTSEDFVYHSLNIVEQLKIDAQQAKVYLYNTAKKTDIETILGKYLQICNN